MELLFPAFHYRFIRKDLACAKSLRTTAEAARAPQGYSRSISHQKVKLSGKISKTCRHLSPGAARFFLC